MFNKKLYRFNKNFYTSLNFQISGVLLILLAIVITLASLQYLSTKITKNKTQDVVQIDIMRTVLTLKMQSEIGQMQESVANYINGDKSAISDFNLRNISYENYRERFPEDLKYKDSMKLLDFLHRSMVKDINEQIFARFDPVKFVEASQRAITISENVGAQLDTLVKELVDEEIADAGTFRDIVNILEDDIPGIVSYTQLRAAVSDLLSSFQLYALEDDSAAKIYHGAMLRTDEALSQLKVLETTSLEVARLKTVRTMVNTMRNHGNKLFSEQSINSRKLALESINDLNRNFVLRIEDVLKLISNNADTQSKLGIDQIVEMTTSNLTKMNYAYALAIFLILSLSLFIKKTIINPIAGVSSILNKVARGNFDNIIEVVARNSEVGDIFASLESLQVDLKELDKLRNEQFEIVHNQHQQDLQLAFDKLKKSESELRAHTKNLEKANGELEQFVHIASHDLREPLKNILGLIGMIHADKETHLAEKASSFIERAKGQVDRLARLIDELRAITKISTPNASTGEISIDEIVLEMEQHFATDLNEKNASITKSVLPTIIGEVPHIKMLFKNLFQNACHHGPDNLQIKVSSEPRNGESIFSFSTNKEGDYIPTEQIFLPFWRGPGVSRDRFGVGLTTCKKIVEKYPGGKMWIDKTKPDSFVICFKFGKVPLNSTTEPC